MFGGPLSAVLVAQPSPALQPTAAGVWLVCVGVGSCQLSDQSGERVALIGHNGAGKTTFLKTIAGVYRPSSGLLQRRGRVYPMIEKSFLTSLDLSGFDALKAHYLMLHLKLEGFDRFCEDVISFSGLAEFIHLPLKTLSEGMASRLLFSMLTASAHECLAIDEMFGTGDAAFFEKAQVRLEAFIEQTGTLILASHSSQLLRRFCQRGLVFSHGKLVFDGLLDHALDFYQSDSAECFV